jgi:hypothetical protein
MLMLICCERKTLLNGWLILADKLKRTGQSYRVWLLVLSLGLAGGQRQIALVL